MSIDALKTKYRGAVVDNYAARRASSPKWVAENRVMEDLLAGFAGRKVVDLPVGTGRFMSAYARNDIRVIGLDVSPDMVSAAGREAELYNTKVELLEVADALELSPERYRADVAVCIRFMNWMSAEAAERVVKNLGALAEEAVVVGIRSVDMAKLSPEQTIRVQRRRAGETRPRKDGKPHNYLHLTEDVRRWIAGAGLVIKSETTVEVTEIGADYVIYILTHADSV